MSESEWELRMEKIRRMNVMRYSLDQEVMKRRPFQEKDGTQFDFKAAGERLRRVGR